jgi:hypothetical protein
MEGMAGNVAKTVTYTRQWDKHNAIWERNKDKAISRYAEQSQDVAVLR